MQKKFLKICESVITRATRGGFLTGDFVKFVDGFTNHEKYKTLGDNIKQMIDEMQKSGYNIRVVGINDHNTTRYPGNPETMTGEVIINIALDQGGGRYTHYCTIPSCCIQPVDHGINLAPLPDSMVRPDGTIIKPVEYEVPKDQVDMVAQTLMADRGGKKVKVEIELGTRQVKIPASSAKDPKLSRIVDYMSGY